MAVHTVIVNEKKFYEFWQHYRTMIVMEHDKKYQKCDTLVIQCLSPRWKDLPMYVKISLVDEEVGNGIHLHLKYN